MKVFETLRMKPQGKGHYTVSCELDGTTYSAITNNTQAIDAWFHQDENIYTPEEGAEVLVKIIAKRNDIQANLLPCK